MILLRTSSVGFDGSTVETNRNFYTASKDTASFAGTSPVGVFSGADLGVAGEASMLRVQLSGGDEGETVAVVGPTGVTRRSVSPDATGYAGWLYFGPGDSLRVTSSAKHLEVVSLPLTREDRARLADVEIAQRNPPAQGEQGPTGPTGPQGATGPQGSAAPGFLSFTFQLTDTPALNLTLPIALPPTITITDMRVSLSYEVTGTNLVAALGPGEGSPGPVATLPIATAGYTAVLADDLPWTNGFGASKVFEFLITGPAVDGGGSLTLTIVYEAAT